MDAPSSTSADFRTACEHAVLYRWQVQMLACADEVLDPVDLTVTDDLPLPHPSSEAHV